MSLYDIKKKKLKKKNLTLGWYLFSQRQDCSMKSNCRKPTLHYCYLAYRLSNENICSLLWVVFVDACHLRVLPWIPNYDAVQTPKIINVPLSCFVKYWYNLCGADCWWYFCLCNSQAALLQTAITQIYAQKPNYN